MAEFAAVLTGANEVPPVVTPASGDALIAFDPSGEVAQVMLSLRYLTGTTVAHIHLGRPGQNGPIVAFLFGPTGPVNFGAVAQLPEVTLTAADLVGPLAGRPLSDLLREMQAGNTYVNAHTVRHPNGEIRGQVFRA